MIDHLWLDVSIDEMREYLKRQYEGMDAIKAVARAILSAASLIVSLLGTLQIITSEVEPAYMGLRNMLLIFALAGYVALVFFSVEAMSPATMKGPIKPNEQVLMETFFGKKEDDILKIRLSAYLNAISQNDPLIQFRNEQAVWASRLLAAVVVILLLVGLLPRQG